MASKAYQDVAKLWATHPNWDANQVIDALASKYSEQQLSSAVGQYIGKLLPGTGVKGNLQQSIADTTEANKKKTTAWSTPQDLSKIITGKAASTDPTAGGKTLTTSPLSPLTGKPVISNLGTAGNFSTAGFNADFQGNQAQGLAPKLTMSPGVDKTTGKYYVQVIDPSTGAGRKVYIFGDPNNPKSYQWMDYEQGAQYFMQQPQFQGPAGISKLKKLLADNGAYRNAGQAGQSARSKGLDGNTIKAIQYYLDEMTTTNFNLGPSQGFISIGGNLTAAPGGASTKSFTNITYTPDDIATTDLNVFMNEQLGRGASMKEANQYLQVLHNYEKNHPDRGTVTTDSQGFQRNRVTYSGATAEDKKMLMVGLLAKELADKNINPDAISKSGGAIARGMQDLQAYAAAYGLGHYDTVKAANSIIEASTLTNAKATNADTLKMMKETLVPGGSIDAEKAKIRAMAKEVYKPLASYIDQGGSIKDIAEQFNSLNQKYLETANPTDVFNPDIQKALMGDGKNIMNTQDYIKYLKNKPEWAKTQNAREEASNYATTILKQFGLMA